MNNKEFNNFYKGLLNVEGKLTRSKGDEYAPNNDRFENFKNGQFLQVPGDTPEGCAWNYMSKHLEATMSALRDLSEGNNRDILFWNEKLGDVRIYCALILGMLKERHIKELHVTTAEVMDRAAETGKIDTPVDDSPSVKNYT